MQVILTEEEYNHLKGSREATRKELREELREENQARIKALAADLTKAIKSYWYPGNEMLYRSLSEILQNFEK